ncbi:MAG: TIGR03668 family PPOX class F420-dependent oxidoreductase [Acidimicrobiia bacterium]
MTLSRGAALARFAAAPVASLATTRPTGEPHIVPVTFIVGGDTAYTMVDAKPKTTTALQRLANIAANRAVSMLAHHYEDDWTGLWWVRVDGEAVISEDPEVMAALRRPFGEKYPQYRDQPPGGPAIVIGITDVTWWDWSR